MARGRYPAVPRSALCAGCLTLLLGACESAPAAGDSVAFDEKFMLRIGAYSVRGADTDLAVLSIDQIGTGFNFVDDLGGDDDVDIPRIDGFYRIDNRHRIEFGGFRIERDGRGRLDVDLNIGDEFYSVGDTVVSQITYEVLKLGYTYSFYRSPEVELSLTLGLDMTDYRFDYELVDGSSADSSETSGPLPMFGFRGAYALDSRWSVHYLSEVLFLETGNSRGSFQNYELDLRYRLNQRIILGAGLTRFSIDVTSDDPDWRGRIADTHQGFLIFASYYLSQPPGRMRKRVSAGSQPFSSSSQRTNSVSS